LTLIAQLKPSIMSGKSQSLSRFLDPFHWFSTSCTNPLFLMDWLQTARTGEMAFLEYCTREETPQPLRKFAFFSEPSMFQPLNPFTYDETPMSCLRRLIAARVISKRVFILVRSQLHEYTILD